MISICGEQSGDSVRIMNGIKYLVMDVDGTLTDGKFYIGDKGELFKAFNTKDGFGIRNILPEYGIQPIIITARQSEIVTRRCAELAISIVRQGRADKMMCLREILDDMNEKGMGVLAQVAYIGDDILDLDCMNPIKENGGIVGCPADAVDAVKEIADFISSKDGGNGAVREFIEWLVCQEHNADRRKRALPCSTAQQGKVNN